MHKLRVVRLGDTSHKIALGLACGAAISFTPLVGTHFIQAGLLAYLLRANMLASLIGTFVGNPLSFPLMWFAAYQLGSGILGVFGAEVSQAMPVGDMSFDLLWDIITTQFKPIFLPWAVGGYLGAAITLPLFYLLFKGLVRGAKRARALALLRKRKKRLKQSS